MLGANTQAASVMNGSLETRIVVESDPPEMVT